MDKFVDLHIHSTASDGSMTPTEIVRYAKKIGLVAIALTDHDTVDGIEQAMEESKRVGLEVVPGVEISLDYNTEMHMLGYFFNDGYKKLEPLLKRFRIGREQRNPRIIEKLNTMGFDISNEEVIAEAQGRVLARPHIASVMVKKGYVKTVAEAFDKYISNGKTAYVKRDSLTPKEGIRAIKEAGGLPVLAHPIHLKLDLEDMDILLSQLVLKGLMGVETYYVDNSREDTINFLKLAQKHNIIATGGSDFHGSFKPDIKMGEGRGNLQVPYVAFRDLRRLAQTLNN